MIDFGYGVKLSTIEKDHLEIMRKWRNDYRIYKWCRQTDLICEEAQQDWYTRQAKDDSIHMYSILDKESQFVGVCGLTSFDPHNRRAEFSLYIGTEHQSKGYGEQALLTLVSQGMMNLGLNSIWGESFDGNPAIEMFKKLGFTHEGTIRQSYYKEAKFIDAHLFSIIYSDWVKNDLYMKELKWNTFPELSP